MISVRCGDRILAGEPWQAWRAPSWEEIATAEMKDKAETKQPMTGIGSR